LASRMQSECKPMAPLDYREYSFPIALVIP